LIGRYTGNHVESSEKMVRAHRSIASKLPEGQSLFRLCLDPAKDLIHLTFPPRLRTASLEPLSAVAAAATRSAAPQRSPVAQPRSAAP
jgi:hypothetical protein